MCKKSKLILILSLLITILFLSCSQNVPELVSGNYSVIFEYPEEECYPNSRLSIFVEAQSDVRRFEKIQIKSLETDYIWYVDDIAKVELNDQQWAGTTNLVVPEDEIIPSGTYEITFYNADEKFEKIYLTIDYDTSFYDVETEHVAENIKKLNGINNIAIYDENNILIYYGERTKELATKRNIWNSYRNAFSYQDIWCTKNDYVMCIMPVEKVILDEE